jgi:hypothetical protein
MTLTLYPACPEQRRREPRPPSLRFAGEVPTRSERVQPVACPDSGLPFFGLAGTCPDHAGEVPTWSGCATSPHGILTFKPANLRTCNLSRINICKSVSKQMTLTLFRINTYEKHRGEGVLWLTNSLPISTFRRSDRSSTTVVGRRSRPGQDVFPGYPLSFDILPNCFAPSQNSTLFFSSNSELFCKNTRGWDTPLFLFNFQLSTLNPRMGEFHP